MKTGIFASSIRSAAFASLILAPAISNAALLFYDGFSASDYNTTPSTNGVDNNSLVRSTGGTGTGTGNGQRPATFGFSTVVGTGGWRTVQGAAVSTYGKVQTTGLSYAGMPTSGGSVDIFRTGTNDGSNQIKDYSRALTPGGLGAGASDLYFSSLIQFDAGVEGQFGIIQNTNILSFGFDASGRAAVYNNGVSLGATTGSFTPGTPYLLVAHVYSGNLVDLYLNPTDLSSEAGSAGQKVLSGISLANFTLGTAITDVRLTGQTGLAIANPDVVFDEIRGATTWAEALMAVPEPTSAALGVLGGLAMMVRRRR